MSLRTTPLAMVKCSLGIALATVCMFDESYRASDSLYVEFDENGYSGLKRQQENGFVNGGRGLRAATRRDSRTSHNVGPVQVVAEKVFGIDLGKTKSALAAMERGKPTIVTNSEGQRTMRSTLAYTKNGDRLVGQIGKCQAVVNLENFFFSVKRFISRRSNEVDEESKQVSYHVLRDTNGNVKSDCPAIGKQFATEEISPQAL